MYLLDILKSLDAVVVAYAFVGFLLLAWVVAAGAIARHKHPRYQQFAPNLLTTVGILGTFVGISIGLANFNVADVDASIPLLLEGLKVAFITSIVGLALSILTRAQFTWANGDDEAAAEDVTPEIIHQDLVALLREVAAGNSLAENIRKGVAGDGDSSLLTQMQLTRTELRDSLHSVRAAIGDPQDDQSLIGQNRALAAQLDQMGERVATEFRNFATQISEIGSKQLIKALEEVIRDFNEKLTEQFGENFKHLDESVKKLVDWQSEYRQQVEQMTQQFKETVKGILVTRDAVSRIADSTSAIPKEMEALDSIIRVAQAQLDDMNRHLAAFAEVRDKAVEAMPEIQGRIDEVMDEMRKAVKKASDHYEIMIDDSAELIKKFERSGTELHQKFVSDTSAAIDSAASAINGSAKTLDDSGRDIERHVSSIGSHLQSAIDNSFNEQNQRLQQLMGGLRESVNHAVNDQNELLEKQLQSLDESMQQEMQRAMQTLANNLAGISGKFTEDYSQLTEQMRRVVQQNRTVA